MGADKRFTLGRTHDDIVDVAHDSFLSLGEENPPPASATLLRTDDALRLHQINQTSRP